MSNIQENIKSRSVALAMILIIYIYLPYFLNVLENGFQISSIYGYIIYVILVIIAIGITGGINKRALVFLSFFGIIILINMLVPYKYYVFIEGVQALIGIAVPCVCISSSLFNLKIFIEKWWKFSELNFPLVLFSVLLLKLGWVHYSVFTSICVPNVFIGSYMMIQGIKKKRWLYVNVFLNVFLTAVFGGRTSAGISVCMILFAYIYSENIKLWKKIVIIMGGLISVYLVLNNLIDILHWISQKLAQYGMKSRSITLLIKQIETKEVYLTNRDYIYSVCIEYIKKRVGLPGGFGIPLYITSGEYYYAHNIILQFFTFFGVWGSVGVFEIILIRNRIVKHIAPLKCRKFMCFLLLSYLGIGMTGSSIWIHYLSTIFISLFFFGNGELYRTIDTEESLK